jgi:hypothetical protein
MDPMHLGLAFPAYGVLYQAIVRKIYDFEGLGVVRLCLSACK